MNISPDKSLARTSTSMKEDNKEDAVAKKGDGSLTGPTTLRSLLAMRCKGREGKRKSSESLDC